MNILFLAKHFNTGGITSYLLTLGEGLVRQGHTVWIASSGGELVNHAQEIGIHHFVCAGLGAKSVLQPKMFAAAEPLKHLVKDQNINIIHANTRVAQYIAAMIEKPTGIPYVSTCHGFFESHLGRKLLPCWGKAVIAISSQVKVHVIGDLNCPAEKVSLISNGVDVERFNPLSLDKKFTLRNRFGIDVEDVVIGHIARLSDVKGQKYLINAMQKVKQEIPGVKCIIAGAGPMEDDLKAQVFGLKLQNDVLFWKVTNRPEEILPLFDLFVMPSVNEGLGLSVMEAQAMEIPVVASKVGGLVDLITHDKTGWLVTSEDSDALAEMMINVLKNPTKLKEVAQMGRKHIEEYFSVDEMVDKTLSVYHSVVHK